MELTIEGRDTECGNNVLSANDIAEFMRSHDTLQQLKVIDSSKSNLGSQLQEQLKLGCDLEINGDELSIQRKIKSNKIISRSKVITIQDHYVLHSTVEFIPNSLIALTLPSKSSVVNFFFWKE